MRRLFPLLLTLLLANGCSLASDAALAGSLWAASSDAPAALQGRWCTAGFWGSTCYTFIDDVVIVADSYGSPQTGNWEIRDGLLLMRFTGWVLVYEIDSTSARELVLQDLAFGDQLFLTRS